MAHDVCASSFVDVLCYNTSHLMVQCLVWGNERSRDVKFCMQSLIVVAGLAFGLPLLGAVEEMKEQAKRFLVRLEREYGEKIPEADTKDGVEMLTKRFGEGVPTFGDTKALLGLDKKTYFMGKVGDLAVEIAYCEPRYAKRGGTYEIVCRGAVVVNIVQSPVITTGKQKK